MHSALLLQSLTYFRPLGYAIVFFGMMLEGDVLLFTAAFLTHQHFFDFGRIIPVVLGGVGIGDTIWYWFGKKFSQSRGRFVRWINHAAEPFDEHLRERPFHTLLISKFTYGLHHAILLRAGASGLGFKRFVQSELVASVFWVLVVGGLGYGSSVTFAFIHHYLQFAEIALLLGIILFVAIRVLATRPLKKKL